ncbi:MAG: hypothetical protein KC421_01640 [Anaerolineales bacterium]|nr:hypothetical protein [Anaerolineales bacterium]
MIRNSINRTLRANTVLIGLSIASFLVVIVLVLALSSVAATGTNETAVTAWTNVINDTFESGIGGTAVDLDGATNGEYFWATSTYTAGAGTTSAWATGGGAQGSALTAGTDNYPPNAESALTYGPVDLSSYAIAQLSYDYWTETEAATDLLQVRISTDGTNFSLLSSFDGSSSGWQSDSINLNSYAGEAQVWVRFYFTSNGSTEDMGVFIDNVLLEASDAQLVYLPVVRKDPTPTPTPTATPVPYFYFDDFSDSNSGWPKVDHRNVSDDCYRWVYKNDVYHADICDDRTDIKASPLVNLPTGDYEIEVDARFSTPDSGWWTAYGIIFDGKDDPNPSNPDLGDFYMLWVLWEGTGQGKYKLINDVPGQQKDVFDWRALPSAYKYGSSNNEWNTWRIVRTNSTISIYLNDQFVTTAGASRPTTNYQVLFGVYVSTYETNKLSVEFDNYKVVALDGSLNYGPANQAADPYFVSGDFSLEALLPQNEE